MFLRALKYIIVLSTPVVIAFSSCNSSTKKTTQDVVSESIILPHPDDSLVLYFNEDMSYATEKIVRAYKLNGTPQIIEEWNNNIKRDYIVGYHNYYTVENDSIKAKYHIHCSYDNYYNRRDNWFGYLAIGLTSSEKNAFEILQTITDDLNNSYKSSKKYSWDEERAQWTNGMQYIYIQPPSRNDETGNVSCAICIMPIDLVHK